MLGNDFLRGACCCFGKRLIWATCCLTARLKNKSCVVQEDSYATATFLSDCPWATQEQFDPNACQVEDRNNPKRRLYIYNLMSSINSEASLIDAMLLMLNLDLTLIPHEKRNKKSAPHHSKGNKNRTTTASNVSVVSFIDWSSQWKFICTPLHRHKRSIVDFQFEKVRQRNTFCPICIRINAKAQQLVRFNCRHLQVSACQVLFEKERWH